MKPIGILAFATFFTVLGPLALADQRPSVPVESGRVSAIQGTLLGRGPFDKQPSELVENAVIRAGDDLSTEDGSTGEVELPGGTFLRIGPATERTPRRQMLSCRFAAT